MKTVLHTLALLCLFALAPAAHAYIGPGAGLSLLGALWGLLAAVGAALFFVLFWPVRRMMQRRREQAEAGDEPAERG